MRNMKKDTKKRVRILLRVSSDQQLEANGDLSIQRKLVVEEVKKHEEWILDSKEYFEGSNSGYKNSVADRDVLQEALRDAENREYDILLAYKDDRLGRKMLEIPMYIMSNPIKMNGAATMAYPGVIRNFAETIRKNLYVIPSSIHEVILVPESGTEDTNLNDMVAEVNHTQVDPKEVLADHVYYYDRKEDHMISCVHENICYC